MRGDNYLDTHRFAHRLGACRERAPARDSGANETRRPTLGQRRRPTNSPAPSGIPHDRRRALLRRDSLGRPLRAEGPKALTLREATRFEPLKSIVHPEEAWKEAKVARVKFALGHARVSPLTDEVFALKTA